MKLDLDALPPEERRLILVATDDTYRRLTERIDWSAVAKRAAFRVVSVAAPPLALLPFVSATLGDALARNGYVAPTLTRALEELRRLRTVQLRVGDIPIPHVSPSEAARRFRFDHDLPIDGAAYALNPVRPNHYVQPALLNERLAREKLSAFLGIAAALGAAEVIVTSGETVDEDGRASAGVPLPDAAGAIGLHATFRSSRQVDRGVVARFDRRDGAPFVPDELRGWLAVDPVIESLARGRLEHRLVEQACTLSFRDMVDLGAEACLALEGQGIQVGGRYHALSASRWSFVVRFW